MSQVFVVRIDSLHLFFVNLEVAFQFLRNHYGVNRADFIASYETDEKEDYYSFMIQQNKESPNIIATGRYRSFIQYV